MTLSNKASPCVEMPASLYNEASVSGKSKPDDFMSANSNGNNTLSHEMQSKREDDSSVESGGESEDNGSLAPLPYDDYVVSLSLGSGMHEVLDTLDVESIKMERRGSNTLMSVETDILSGIESAMVESVAMLSLTSGDQDANDEARENALDNSETSSTACCIHEGTLTNMYRLNDPANKFGGKTNAIAIKVLAEQFPDASQIARLQNEKEMSIRLSSKCTAVRAALTNGPSMMGAEGDPSRMLCLEWAPGVTLREWARAQRKELSGNISSSDIDAIERKERNESIIRIAWKIAHSLSEIHEAGGVSLNNISAENIIVNKTSGFFDGYDIHFIGLGSASVLKDIQRNEDGSSVSCEESGVQRDLCSLGEVFFEIFTGQSPRNQADSIDISSSNSGDDQRKNFRPLRELRSILSMSQVPSQVAVFILELMGLFLYASHHANSGHYHYTSAKEVSERLYNIKLAPEHGQLNSQNQGSAKSLGCLNFSPDCLYGREEQQAALMSAYERVILCGGACEVVVVSGISGAGKTTFVEQTLRAPITSRGGHFLHVKFDQFCQAKPLAAILTAFAEFCDTAYSPINLELLFNSLKKVIGEEGLSALAQLIPSFGKIISKEIQQKKTSVEGLMAQNRLIFVFQAFVKAIAGPANPMIILLDDLQWADRASLDLVRSLIMCAENSSLLFVEGYRVNEVTGSNHPFSVHLNDIKDTIALTEIQINNLNMNYVNELLSDAMCEPQPITESLSNIIYRKTGGNILLIIQFARSLWDEGLLWYSSYMNAWQWDAKLINAKDVLENAADLIATKILSLPSDLQVTLKQMACLGSKCDKSTLSLLVSAGDDIAAMDASKATAIFENLDIAVHEGILDMVGSKYKFAHDQIQLATYSLIPECERSSWHLQIGMQMIKECKEKEHDEMLFVIVDQLNKGKSAIVEETRRIDLAELNYRAGDKAKSSGMFSSSALYFEEGISLLDKSQWEKHYQLWLHIHTSYAESEFRNGNFEKMAGSLDLVLSHGKCFDDQLLAYRTVIFSLGAQKKLQEAIEMGLGLFEEAGIGFPEKPDLSIVQAELLKAKRILDGNTVDTLTSKQMSDKKMIILMEILESLSLYALYSKPIYLPLFVCRITELSARHGMCQSTIHAIAIYSMILCGKFGDVKGGETYGIFALNVLERTKARHLCCRVHPALYGIVFPRTNHLHICRDPLLDAYHECVKVGDTEYAMVNAAIFSTLSFQGGKKLAPILKFIEDMEKKAKEYRQVSTLQLAYPMKQAILNLTGRSDTPALLEGEAISFREYFSIAAEKPNMQVSCRLYLYQMQLAYMFGELELAGQMVGKSSEIESILLGKFECCEMFFYEGLISLAQARKTTEGNWSNLAEVSIEKMQKWAEDAPCNCEHKLHLLEAEQCFCDGSNQKAMEKYESAILLSGKNGFIQDQALSCERVASFYLKNGDETKASMYYGKAHDIYLEWGATVKADHLCMHSPF